MCALNKTLVLFVAFCLCACENVPSKPEAIAFDTLKAAGVAIDSVRRDVEFAREQGKVTPEQWTRFAQKYNAINESIIAAAKVLKVVLISGEWEQPSTPEIDQAVQELITLVATIIPPRTVSKQPEPSVSELPIFSSSVEGTYES